MSLTNVMVIGVGPHARRIYVPLLKKYQKEFAITTPCMVDIVGQEEKIERYLDANDVSTTMLYIDPSEGMMDEGYFELSLSQKKMLTKNAIEYSIDAVIIATEPLSHKTYVKRALELGLHILMDKPISSRVDVSTDNNQALGLMQDYQEIKNWYINQGKGVVFSCMSQRRYHPAYQKINAEIEKVAKKTSMPISSMIIQHSDGQRRFPDEFATIDYHGYTQGYGKCSHSGYHFFDIASMFLNTSAKASGKAYDQGSLQSTMIRPSDVIGQLRPEQYEKIFAAGGTTIEKKKQINDKVLQTKTLTKITDYKKMGEVDAHISFCLENNGNKLTHVHLSLLHNGFSQRSRIEPKQDLYKGNGRVRHESILIHQGPFQAIQYHSYQSKQIRTQSESSLAKTGGEFHSKVCIYRNSELIGGKDYEEFDFSDISDSKLQGYGRGHQEKAREECFKEFFECIYGQIDITEMKSSILDHDLSVGLMAYAYYSAAQETKKKPALVTFDL